MVFHLGLKCLKFAQPLPHLEPVPKTQLEGERCGKRKGYPDHGKCVDPLVVPEKEIVPIIVGWEMLLENVLSLVYSDWPKLLL